jgi:hypothetical protein
VFFTLAMLFAGLAFAYAHLNQRRKPHVIRRLPERRD